VVAINKWDGLDPDTRDQVKTQFARKLGFLDFAVMHRISALHGSGVGLLLDEVDRAYANATRDLPTPVLTRLLEAAVTEHQPPLVQGRRIKLRYAHQGGRNPPIIVIHGNQTERLPETYRRYLINRFRERAQPARRHPPAPGAQDRRHQPLPGPPQRQAHGAAPKHRFNRQIRHRRRTLASW
jgi:GTPase